MCTGSSFSIIVKVIDEYSAMLASVFVAER